MLLGAVGPRNQGRPTQRYPSSMNVQLHLDKPRNHFTNLDFITGKVVLRTRSQEDVDQITVKLEGESRTRLMSQGLQNTRHEKPRPVLEVHKVGRCSRQ